MQLNLFLVFCFLEGRWSCIIIGCRCSTGRCRIILLLEIFYWDVKISYQTHLPTLQLSKDPFDQTLSFHQAQNSHFHHHEIELVNQMIVEIGPPWIACLNEGCNLTHCFRLMSSYSSKTQSNVLEIDWCVFCQFHYQIRHI